jgi:Flp pilus assembly protein TadD
MSAQQERSVSGRALAGMLAGAIGVAAGVAAWLPHHHASMQGNKGNVGRLNDQASHVAQASAVEIRVRFEQAVLMLHARQYDHAVTALHRLLQLAPDMPEAHVNMGYAMLGLHEYQAARDFFNSAVALRPRQANAYYGLALAEEGSRDLSAAKGAMRTYLHFAPAGAPHIAKARAALWEWEGRQ